MAHRVGALAAPPRTGAGVRIAPRPPPLLPARPEPGPSQAPSPGYHISLPESVSRSRWLYAARALLCAAASSRSGAWGRTAGRGRQSAAAGAPPRRGRRWPGRRGARRWPSGARRGSGEGWGGGHPGRRKSECIREWHFQSGFMLVPSGSGWRWRRPEAARGGQRRAASTVRPSLSGPGRRGVEVSTATASTVLRGLLTWGWNPFSSATYCTE